MKQLIRKFRWELFRVFHPKIITIKPTFRCNQNCKDCIVNKSIGKRPIFNEISVQDWLDIIFKEKAKIVNISGGEPLIYRDLPILVNTLIKKGYIVSIFTNLKSLDGLSIKPSWRVIFRATYHDNGTQDRLLNFMMNLWRYRSRFYVQVIELETNFIEGSIIKIKKDTQSSDYVEIYAPDGRKAYSHTELEKLSN